MLFRRKKSTMVWLYALSKKNYCSRYLVTIDISGAKCSQSDNIENEMSFYKKETYKFKEPIFTIKPREMFIGKSPICIMSEMSGAFDNTEFDGKTLLLVFRESI